MVSLLRIFYFQFFILSTSGCHRVTSRYKDAAAASKTAYETAQRVSAHVGETKERAEASKKAAEDAKKEAEDKKKAIEARKKKQEDSKKKVEDALKDADGANDKVNCARNDIDVASNICLIIFKVKDAATEAAKPIDVSAECRAGVQSVMPSTQQILDLSHSPVRLCGEV